MGRSVRAKNTKMADCNDSIIELRKDKIHKVIEMSEYHIEGGALYASSLPSQVFISSNVNCPLAPSQGSLNAAI